MPVEIKELVIRAIAVKQQNGSASQTHTNGTMSDEQINRIIEACVEEVLKIIERKESR